MGGNAGGGRRERGERSWRGRGNVEGGEGGGMWRGFGHGVKYD